MRVASSIPKQLQGSDSAAPECLVVVPWDTRLQLPAQVYIGVIPGPGSPSLRGQVPLECVASFIVHRLRLQPNILSMESFGRLLGDLETKQ
jgi:hypothetical protein